MTIKHPWLQQNHVVSSPLDLWLIHLVNFVDNWYLIYRYILLAIVYSTCGMNKVIIIIFERIYILKLVPETVRCITYMLPLFFIQEQLVSNIHI